ncbi:MAG: hypothetical protein RI907_861 [Pseudomonadota bacterium]|jgi:type IV pilus assembly protein PilE
MFSRPQHPLLGRPHGFTLIEVMIVVAIVAILSSVALPAYTNYIRRGQLQEAFTNLASYRIKLEQYYQDNRRYAADIDATSCGGAAANQLTAAELGGEASHFTYTCTVSADATSGAAAQHFTITATGNSGSNVAGYAYTLDDAGAKRTTGFAGEQLTLGCWATKSAGECS